ncbi:flippase [Candidatus Peregrinibacteria bacterium]|nr:flippase [Candidatus Peregrinibacteria bacterium]
MSIARKILENTFVQILGKVATGALSIVILKIISSYLGTAGYGDYTTVYQYLAFFGIIADFGIYTITVKEMSRDQSQIPRILGNVLGLRTLLTFIAMILGAIVVFLVPTYRNTLIPIGVIVATFSTLFTILNGTISTVLQVHLKMNYTTYGLVIGKIVSVIYMAWAAFIGFPRDPVMGFYHLLFAGVIANLVMFVITAYYTRRYTAITYRFDFDFWADVFKKSLPYGVALVLNTIYFRVNVIVLSSFLPHSLAVANGAVVCNATLCGDTEVGLYGVAMRMLEVMIIIPVYFMNSVLPIMTRYIEEQSEKIRQLMQYSFDFLVASAAPLLAGGFVLAVPIVQFISDPQFVSGHTYRYGSDIAVKILMFAMAFSFINSLFGFTLVVLNKQVKLMYINAGAVLFNIISNILVVAHWGFRGAAVTSVFSELLILIFTYHVAQRQLGFYLHLKTFSKLIFAALMMGLVLWVGMGLLPHAGAIPQLAILVPIGSVVYLGIIYATRAVTPEMMSLLKKKA